MFNTLWFPLWWMFKRLKLDLMLCQTVLRFQRYRPCEVRDKLKISVVLFRFFCCFVLFYFVFLSVQDPPFGVSLQNILHANRIWVFLNHLNKHKEKPATDMQTVWNETSSCVFSSRFSLGCSVDYQ